MKLLVPAFLSAAALLAAPAAAQDAAPPTPEQAQAAARHFALANGLLQAPATANVPQEVKNRIFLCIYSAPFKEISEKATAFIEANDQLSLDDDNHVRNAILFVCGYRPQAPQQ
ncbi:MAG: hypothetical protein V2J26_13025 [Pacificimonas sp.]|jgi:hypothetical protein|nr:hypothetical protein [Pacificimonas sp.]